LRKIAPPRSHGGAPVTHTQKIDIGGSDFGKI